MEISHRMTSAHFDAPASSTPRHIAASPPPRAGCGPSAARIIRLIWLTARFVRRDSVTIEDYQQRFGASVRTFRRDIAVLRDAGLYIAAEPHDYRLTFFASDTDAA